jgi:transcriptional regulator with XRE-family HTH domain
MDDQRAARAVRALRHRLGWRQVDLARTARVSQASVSLLERGRVDGLSIRALRRLCSAMDADVVVLVRWRGGDLDRLLDERHARLGEVVARTLERLGWEVAPEVSYSVYGERGSIDLLCWHAPSRTLLVIELKSELTSIEETLRRFDVKRRLATRIAIERFGWNAAIVGRLLVLPNDRTARRRVAAHALLLERALPNSPAEVRRWLRDPSGSLEGILFVTDNDDPRGRHGRRARKRVRRAPAASIRA